MKRILTAALLVAVASASFAFDFGGYLDNTTGLSTRLAADAPIDLIQRTQVALWARAPLGSWAFDAQGSYTYTPILPILFDVDRMTLSTTATAPEAGVSTLGVVVGRTGFADPTGSVLAATLDGLQLELGQARSSLRVAVATNALRQRPTNPLAISRLDTSPGANAGLLAPPRLIASVEYRLLEAFAQQNLTLGAMIQEDLRPQDELTAVGETEEQLGAGGRLDTQYVSLVLSGALVPGVFHRTSYTLNTGRSLGYLEDGTSATGSSYQYALILAHLAGVELTWFLPEVLNSRARLFGQFSTGDADSLTFIEGNSAGTATSFVPLAAPRYSDVFSLKPGNSAHIGVSYSVRPLGTVGMDVLQAELSSVSYLRTAGSGAVSEGSVDPQSDGLYVGTDLNLALVYQPFSDLRVVMTNGVFVPNADVMNAVSKDVKYQGTLQGVLRF